MSEQLKIIAEKFSSQEEASALIGRLFEVAEPDTVFGEPVQQGAYTVITARELHIGLGAGFGGGGGVGGNVTEESSDGAGYGGGGGGGGGATGRPVAVIEIGPSGVRVEPIVDATKIALAFFTALGSMALMLARMARGVRDE